MQNIPLVVACIRKENNFPPPKKITLKLKDISKKKFMTEKDFTFDKQNTKYFTFLKKRKWEVGRKEKFCYRIINESIKYIQNLTSHKKIYYYICARKQSY